MSNSTPVVIVGGGWAGCAAALELNAHAIPVALYESAPQLGGRARNAPFGALTVDNGQHLLIGAYSETLRLLAMMGVEEAEVFRRERLHLQVVEGDATLELSPPPLPAPLHLAWALLGAKGTSNGIRLRALAMCVRLLLSGFRLERDISVYDLLQHHRQGPFIIRTLWEPLCIATLNTPIERASAQVFLRVLKDSFSRHRHDADMLLPRQPLGDLFPNRAADYLRRRGATVTTGVRVDGLMFDQGHLTALSIGDVAHHCSDVILATTPRAAASLLEGPEILRPLCEQIGGLGSQPITTLYLQYPQSHRLEQPMIGMSGTTCQWLFDRRDCGQPGLIAVVISAEGPHDAWDNEALTGHVIGELQRQFPGWPQPQHSRVIRERRATFDCRVGIESRRPGNTTPISGLWLAGDYTATGYPATLEGAVRSGVECAHQIIANRRQ